jgi:putative transcriptional regulator
MNKFSKDLVASLTEAVKHAEGKKTGTRVQVIEVPDVRALREELHMSQTAFATAYRIPLATLKNWEQGRRLPDARPQLTCRRLPGVRKKLRRPSPAK